MDVAVIIPFFQRERGLLYRAVDSVFNQKSGIASQIIVVDDGSPLSAKEELAEFSNRPEVLLIRQNNAGVAAARNKALDSLASSAQIVAFLDSDDWWSPVHLQKIIVAFSAGADFYFCNYSRDDKEATTFQVTTPDLFSIPPFCENANLRWLDRSLLDLVIGKCPLAPSTCAYRLSKCSDVRFDNTFRRSCEDRKFFAQLALRLGRTAFSTDCDVNYGVGVNIFGSAVWGTMAGVERVLDTARFHIDVAELGLSNEQRSWNEAALASLDNEFAENVTVAALHTRHLPISLISQYCHLRPGTLRNLGRTALGLAWSKIAHWA